MAKVSSAVSFGAFSALNRRRRRAKRFSRAVVDVLEPRRLLASWVSTEVAGGVVGGSAGDVEAVDGRAYVNLGGWLTILDVSVPSNPVQLGRLAAEGYIAVSGSYLYLGGLNGLSIVDVSNPATPAIVVSSWDPAFGVGDLCVVGSYAYVVGGDRDTGWRGLEIIDVSNPANPTLKGSFELSSGGRVTVAGSYAYLTAAYMTVSKLTVVNIADPAHPVEVGSCYPRGGGDDVAIEGTAVYTLGAGMSIIDVSNPSAPAEINWFPASGEPRELRVSDSIVYIVGGANWMEDIDVSNPLSPVFLGFLDTYGNAYEVAVSGSTAYVVDGTKTLAIVNVTDPSRPYRLTEYKPPNPGCVVTSGTTAYAGAGNLYFYDIQNFDAPSLAGTRKTTGSIKDVAISGSYLYTTEGGVGFEVFNISTPGNPVRVAGYGAPDVLNSMTISGSYLYVAANPVGVGGGSLDIFSLAIPAAPTLVGRFVSTIAASDVAVSGTIAYLAAADGLRIIDVSDPANMVQLGSLSTSGTADHIVISGSRAYVGGDIIDVSNPAAPVRLSTSATGKVLAVWGNFAFTTTEVQDINNPAAFTRAGFYTHAASDIALYGDSSAVFVGYGLETIRLSVGESLPPTDISLSPSSITENWGSLVGTLSTSDPNGGSIFTYSLVSGVGSDDNASFYFQYTRDKIYARRTLDYETRNSYSIRVRSTDPAGMWFEKAFTISVIDVPETPPTDISLSATSVAEDQPQWTLVGTLSSTDPDPRNTFTYRLVSGTGSDDNASFMLSENKLYTTAIFHFATKSSYSIRVRTTDQGGLFYEKVFTITVTSSDTTAPSVTAVYVRGSTWSSGYLSFLAANTAGSSATYGYAIPVGSGAAQLQTLPWRNLNQISIAFSEDVSVSQAQLAIAGSVGSYSVSGFSYDTNDHVATWTLSSAIGPDKLYVALPGSGATPVKDVAGGNVLDGEWVNPGSYGDASSTSVFPSGDGTVGGDFAFRFDVLPGDSTGGSLGKVNVADALQTKGRSGLPVTVSTYRSDFDGNNAVNVADVLYVKNKSSIYSLPVNPPVVPVFGPTFLEVSLLLSDVRRSVI